MKITDAIPNTALGPTFLTTYTFDPHLFEHWLLPMLAARGSDPIFLFVDDREGYSSLLDAGENVRGAGDQYHVLRFRQPRGVFHPKVFYFAGVGVALVGSGNLTRSGLSSNLEAFCRLQTGDHPATVQQLVQFFRDLANDERCLATKETRTDALARLTRASDHDPGAQDPWFAHTLHASLFDQLGPRMEVRGESTTTICSPFHHPEHLMAQELQLQVGSPELRIAASRRGQPQPPSGIPHGFVAPQGIEAPDRHLHAKVYESRGDEVGWQIIGSANATAAAWWGGNIEAVVFQAWSDSSAESTIDLTESFLEGEWDAPMVEWEPDAREKGGGWQIIEAREHDGRLQIVVEGAVDGTLHARYVVAGGDEVELALEADQSWRSGATDVVSAILELWDDAGARRRTVLHRPERLRQPLAIRRFRGILDQDRTEPAPAELRLEAMRLLRRQLRAIGATASAGLYERAESTGTPSSSTTDDEIRELEADEVRTARDLGVFGRVVDTVFGPTRGRRLSDILGRYARGPEYTQDTDERLGQMDRNDEGERAQAERALRHQVVTDREVRSLLSGEIEWLASEEGHAMPMKQWRDALSIILRATCGLVLVAELEDRLHDLDELQFLLLRALEIAWKAPSWGGSSEPGYLLTQEGETEEIRSWSDVAVLACLIEGLAANDRIEADLAPIGRLQAVARGLGSSAGTGDDSSQYGQDHPVFQLVETDTIASVVQGIANATDPWMEAYAKLEPLRRLETALRHEGVESAVRQAREAGRDPLIRWWARLAKRNHRPTDSRVVIARNSACLCGARIPDQILHELSTRPSSHHVCESCHCIVLPGPLFMQEPAQP